MHRHRLIYHEHGFTTAMKALLHSFHIQLIRLVAGYRPVILDVTFCGGIKLDPKNKKAYISHCKFIAEDK